MIADAYLTMAEAVLQLARRPMSTHQILREAYIRGFVPSHLHGKTQHKTLGARLSGDILRLRAKSRFFRVRPGRFFLTQLMTDESLPEEYRTPYIAKRRTRQLDKEFIAYLRADAVADIKYNECLRPDIIKHMIDANAVGYHRSHIDHGLGLDFYTFAVVTHGDEILTYRRGSYREQRAGFTNHRTIGFATPVCHDDYTLFDYEDHGAVSAALTAVAIDLDLEFTTDFTKFEEDARLRFCVPIAVATLPTFVAVVEIKAPRVYRFHSKRLAINELEWTPISRARDRHLAFDPWSNVILEKMATGC